MSEETRNEFQKLVDKYLNGSATERERKALEEYYALLGDAPELSELMGESKITQLGDRLKKRIKQEIQPVRKPFYSQPYYRIAALAVILLGVIWLVKLNPEKRYLPAAPVKQARVKKDSINRFLTLPDGSTIVLHRGSQLEIMEDFNQSERAVRLTGEAFFDVRHDPSRPFVIHTGKIKTTVLGTAFNIRAWPSQKDIIVSVNRGKVRVEDENKLIAVLTPDKQIVYNKKTTVSGEQTVESEELIEWIQQDMAFEEMAFGDLATHLGARYGVEIKFQHPELQKCLITGRFSGTETLEEVMRTLSITLNARYTINEGVVLIDGNKCS